MDTKDQIIALGRALKVEQQAGYAETLPGGMALFLDAWRAEANGALSHEPVQQVMALLDGYAEFDPTTRRARVDIAIDALRGMFRKAGEASTPAAETKPRPATSPKRAVAAKPLTLASPIADVPGIGKQNAVAFRRLEVRTVEDLLYHFPHRYDDFSQQKQIADLKIGEVETITAEVLEVRSFGMRNGRGGVELRVGDESGVLKVTFFNQPWIVKQLQLGTRIVLSGKVDNYMGLRQMAGPKWEPFTNDELVHTGRLVPVHPLTKGLMERNARQLIKQLIDSMVPHVQEHLPELVRQRAGLLPLQRALQQMHFPDSRELLEQARTRLGFDEFLYIQLGVLQRKVLFQGERGYAMPFDAAIHADFQAKLPFTMTGAQQRALAEIFGDMARPVPMARLLQGDVGSGKTVVAAAAAVQAIANGYQAAIMAPTEILAEQHYKGLKKLLGGVAVPRGQGSGVRGQEPDLQTLAPKPAGEAAMSIDEIKRILGMMPEDDLDGAGVRVALLTGSLGAKERRRVLEAIAQGDVDLVVGTHALITESVRYHALGIAIVDEQHRFGVEQRQRLKDKGFNPHLLVMTATPIPRTLTLTIFGDLDTAILDELPPGRQEIRTRWVTSVEREKVYRHMRREIEKGRQAYVVCPLVDESEKVDLPSAEEMYVKLGSEVFPDLRVCLIHGKLLPREKDEVMIAFRNHEYDIMVATAVIEVGIDVPNSSTMLIEGAVRFGLAQLHQFRGRVGRGVHQSFCVLVSDRDNEQTKQRLEAMEQTTDGFKLAEIDLQLRGPGEFFGTRQSGTPDLKVASLADTRLLHAANREAQVILAEDPRLEKPEHELLKKKVDAFWAETLKSG
ncbi:MAG: ATP-dependent DNA helicase RecG [Roseiflexaceae bacterium]|nr:ATP-dependent DNA helicase RecG [Roseiflexaceae bacterium]